MKFAIITKNSELTIELLDILQKEWPDAYGWLTDVIDDWSLTDFPQIIVATENDDIIGYYSLVAQELVKNNHGTHLGWEHYLSEKNIAVNISALY